MKFAIIADIHANLEAFQVVLADIKEQKCTHYACVGDVVGYGANPRECLKIVRDLGMPCVKGNHDEYCSTDEQLEGFNPHAAEAVNWTRLQLNEDERLWLRELKLTSKWSRVSPWFMPLWTARNAGATCSTSWPPQPASLIKTPRFVFSGIPTSWVAFIRDKEAVRGGTYSKFKVDPTRKYFVNVGSVGQPRDNNPKAAYVVYDVDEGTIELRRLDYDIAAAQKKIRDAGLPERLAERLAFGR